MYINIFNIYIFIIQWILYIIGLFDTFKNDNLYVHFIVFRPKLHPTPKISVNARYIRYNLHLSLGVDKHLGKKINNNKLIWTPILSNDFLKQCCVKL